MDGMTEVRKSPSGRGRNYTPLREVVHCALRTADDFRRFSICSNHHRGSYPSPALAYASYPFVDLPPGIILRCKLFPSDKFAEIRLYFFYEIAYNGAGDKSEFGGENMTAHMRLR